MPRRLRVKVASDLSLKVWSQTTAEYPTAFHCGRQRVSISTPDNLQHSPVLSVQSWEGCILEWNMNATVNLSSQSLTVSLSGNYSSNDTQESCPYMPLGSKEVRVTMSSLTMVVALVGNTLLIIAFVRMKVQLMLLIANMAASDLLTATFLLPRHITINIVGSTNFQIQGLAGTILCKLVPFLADISLSVSTQSMVIIAVERFLAVVYPLKTRRITAKTRRVLVALTWVVAMTIHIPYLYAFELVKNTHDEGVVCSLTLDGPTLGGYAAFLLVIILLLPLLITSILYPIIFMNLRVDKMSAHRSTKGVKRSRQRNMNLLQLALSTVVTFAICWMSYIVIIIFKMFAPNALPKCSYVFGVVDNVSHLLTSCYCAINPLICFIFLRNFRGQFMTICKPRRRRSLNILDSKMSGRSRASTGNTSIGVELVYATSNPGANIQDTAE